MGVRCKKLGVANYRSFGPGDDVSATLPGDPSIQYVDIENDIIVLIGANNCGKSTLLHAYDAVRLQKRKLDADDFFHRNIELPVVLEVWLKADVIDDSVESTRKWYDPSKGNLAIVRKVWSAPGEEAKKYSYDWKAGAWDDGGFGGWDSILQSEMPEPIWLKAIMSEEEILSTVRDLVKEVVFAKLRGTEELDSAEKALRALSDVIESDEFLADFGGEVTKSLEKTFPGAKVSVSNPPATKGVLSLFEKQAQVDIVLNNSPKLAFGRHGHGLQRQCALSLLGVIARETAKIEGEKAKAKKKAVPPASESGRILLIEEPELFLSPSAVRAVRENLYLLAATERFQVMAATHSPLMVDLARPKQTISRAWIKEQTGTSVFQMDSQDMELKDLLALDDTRPINPYYAEAFFSNEVIICEGEAEAVALAEMFSRLKEKLPADRFFVLVAGGNNSVPIYQRLCVRFGIPHYMLYDLERKINPKNGNDTGAWGVHKTIIEQCELAAARGISSRRFIQVRNFESAHGLDEGGDKRRKAREFAKNVDLSLGAQMPILQFCELLQGTGNWHQYTMQDLDALDAQAA